MALRVRENTFKIDLKSFSKRPTYEQIHDFVHGPLGLSVQQVLRLQMNHSQNCAHIKCISLKIAQDAVIEHNERHEIEVNNKRTKVRLIMDDGGIEVKIHDLSENVRNEEIVAFLNTYGEVLSIRDEVWTEGFKYQGVISGVRIAKMVLRKHIKSFVVIKGEETLISYRNQPQLCRHCYSQLHPGSTCVENKKLMGQKNDLNQRLENARGEGSGANTGSSSSSYAAILSGASTSGTNTFSPINANTQGRPNLMPNFAYTRPHEQQKTTSTSTTPPNLPNSTPATTNDHHLDIAQQPAGSSAGVLDPQQPAAAERTEEGEINDNSALKNPLDIERISPTTTATVAEQPTQQSEATTTKITINFGAASEFKIPQLPTTPNPLDMQISDTEMHDTASETSLEDSSTEGGPYKKSKRGRGRAKNKNSHDY